MTNDNDKCYSCICPRCIQFVRGCAQKSPCLRICQNDGSVKECELFQNSIAQEKITKYKEEKL